MGQANLLVTNIPAEIWTPRPCNRHNPATRCVHCREGTRHEMMMMRNTNEDQRPIAKLPGYSQTASHNRIAPNAAEEDARWSQCERQSGKNKTARPGKGNAAKRKKTEGALSGEEYRENRQGK